MCQMRCILVDYNIQRNLNQLSARVILHFRNGKRNIVLVLELTTFDSILILKRNSEGPAGRTNKWPDRGCRSAEGSLVSPELAQSPPKTEPHLLAFYDACSQIK